MHQGKFGTTSGHPCRAGVPTAEGRHSSESALSLVCLTGQAKRFSWVHFKLNLDMLGKHHNDSQQPKPQWIISPFLMKCVPTADSVM